MKISLQWLREWVAVRLDPNALAERLTLAGLEVGTIEPAFNRLMQNSRHRHCEEPQATKQSPNALIRSQKRLLRFARNDTKANFCLTLLTGIIDRGGRRFFLILFDFPPRPLRPLR